MHLLIRFLQKYLITKQEMSVTMTMGAVMKHLHELAPDGCWFSQYGGWVSPVTLWCSSRLPGPEEQGGAARPGKGGQQGGLEQVPHGHKGETRFSQTRIPSTSLSLHFPSDREKLCQHVLLEMKHDSAVYFEKFIN